MRVLVTGAAGFIGHHVGLALKDAGHEIIGLDVRFHDFARVYPEFYDSDITKPLGTISGLDAVIHLAAVANPRECDKAPTKAFDVNVNGTNQVLAMALKSGARKVVFSSTAHVYDIPPRYLPTDEQHPLRLNNTYTTTKLLGEQLCHLYWENHGLAYTTLRLFNAYGDGQAKGYFIPDMLEKARTGQMTLDGCATTKDWVHIDDVARAFVLALESSFVGPINIGTGVETRLFRIACDIALRSGATLTTADNGGTTRMQADIGRALRVLGWEPRVSMTEGLARVTDAAKSEPVPA